MHPMPMNGIAPPYLAFLPCLGDYFPCPSAWILLFAFPSAFSSRIDFFFRQVFDSRYSRKAKSVGSCSYVRLDIFPGHSWRQQQLIGGSTPYIRADERNCRKEEGGVINFFSPNVFIHGTPYSENSWFMHVLDISGTFLATICRVAVDGGGSTPYIRADEQNCHKREGVIDLALIPSDWIVAFGSAFPSRINFFLQICYSQ